MGGGDPGSSQAPARQIPFRNVVEDHLALGVMLGW